MNLLPKNYFLTRLRIEKRRADRSKAPLSIALLCFLDKNVENNIKTQEFLRSLQKNTRETDIKGWLENDVIGLILPDTDGRGVQKYIEKIRNGNGGLAFSVVTGTYPDDLFHKLLAGAPSQPDLFPINLDESEEPRKIELALKRAVDVLGAIVGLILFSPLMLVTSLAVKLTSPGPVIFTQNRIGKKGSRFHYINSDPCIGMSMTNFIGSM